MKLNDRNDLRTLRVELETTLLNLLSKYDMSVKLGGMKFNGTGTEMSVKLTVVKGNAEKFAKTEFERACEMNTFRFPWLKPEHYLLRFFERGKEYVLTGIGGRGRCPFHVKQLSNDKGYRVPEAWVKRAVDAIPPTIEQDFRPRRKLEL